MYINTCCNYESYTQYDICPECKEHCDWEVIDQEEWENRLETENNIEQHQINKNDSN